MEKSKDLAVWSLVGVLGLLVALWAYPRAFLYLPGSWTVSRSEARTIVLERLRDLGEPVINGYVVSRLEGREQLERRLSVAGAPEGGTDADLLRDEILQWEITVYEPGALTGAWAYRGRMTLDGRVTALERRLRSPLPGGLMTAEEARLEADYFLTEQGLDPGGFEFVDEIVRQAGERTDRTFRYRGDERDRRAAVANGIEVEFSGDALIGVRTWMELEEESAEARALQPQAFFELLRILAIYIFLPVVAVPFVRRYHAGEIGVRRGLQIMGLMLGLSVVFLVLTSRGASEGLELGVFSRQQSSWVWGLQFGALLYLPLALLGFVSWSVGESICRQTGGHRLAAFDAFLDGRWANATVASSAARGLLSGLGLGGAVLAVSVLARLSDAGPLLSLTLGPWWEDAPWMGVALLAFALLFGLYGALLGRLFLVAAATKLLGRWGGALLAVIVGAALLWVPGPGLLPVSFSIFLAVLTTAVLVWLFLAYDLLTSLLASCVAIVLVGAYPMVMAASLEVQLQGYLALLAVATPALLTARFLNSRKVAVYEYDEVPPHVRRIAERERLRLEVETARSIQQSILPDLPRRLGAVGLVHAYLPASEVGGDFYDVIELRDGRLAVAVGDVAGHGVSSGLVMAAVKSSLGVQVALDPSVGEVFRALNRIVFESAGKRLLTTLCYALVDVRRGELAYASAGHLFPYRMSRAGGLLALESVAYPLGVREDLEIAVRLAPLEAGDRLVLFSDGLVEARSATIGEPFGFERLEASLARHSGDSLELLRDGVLEEIGDWSGDGPSQDDLTLVVLELPVPLLAD